MIALLKSKLARLGFVVLTVLAGVARIKYLKTKRDKAEVRAEILEARVLYQRVKKDIRGKEKLALLAKRKKQEEIIKEGLNEEITGLSKPNDY